MYATITAVIVFIFLYGLALLLVAAPTVVMFWLWKQGGEQPQFHRVTFGTSDAHRHPQQVG